MSFRIKGLIILLVFSACSLACFSFLKGRALMVGVGVLILLFFIIYLLLMASQHNAGGRRMKRTGPPPSYESVAAKLAEIEQELKRMGAWQDRPLAPEQYNFQSPFGMDTMAFEQWLQFVLIPNVKGIIERRGEFPAHSEVASHAIREFDGRDDTSRLHELLYEFDRLFGPIRFYGAG